MSSCVIYARVSTKEQHDEGYSIPAQLKAVRAFCAAEGFAPVAEFVEAESAGRTGRSEFGRMLDYLASHREVTVVVAHKLDRLYRNFADQVSLEEGLGVRVRYVVGDVPDTPQGELMRDVQLSMAKFYLGNLRQEVVKGMEEKVAQGGWPHRAPLGYLNDRQGRSVAVDPGTAPLVVHAFERYAAGAVSVAELTEELAAKGLVSRAGKPLSRAGLHRLLGNPFYVGRIPYKGDVFPGAHEPLVSPELFGRVQDMLSANRNGTKRRKAEYALRGVMRCGECGCLITAGTHKGHVYYRCTHGKGKGSCSQRSYIREESLVGEVADVLGHIEVGPEAVARLLADCEAYLTEKSAELEEGRAALQREAASVKSREKKLLAAYLDGAVPVEVYRESAEELASSRRALELRIAEYGTGTLRGFEEVRELLSVASSVRIDFEGVEGSGRRELLHTVLCNVTVADGHIASYQYKDPFGVLEMSPEGAFHQSWWAILDLNQ